MSPEQLARNNTESGHQKALFAWANMARLYGFEAANNMQNYSKEGVADLDEAKKLDILQTVDALQWLHSIPNGGARDPATAARMKAEGVKRGVYDVFLPVPQRRLLKGDQHGLYIELKRVGKGVVSGDQVDFGLHCDEHCYANFVCEGWREAADVIQRYLTNESP